MLHGTSPVKATSALYGVPLPFERRLDQFGQPRATEQYHDRFRYTNDVMDYLHPRYPKFPSTALAFDFVSDPTPFPEA